MGISVSEDIAERSCEPSTQNIREGRGIGGALQQGFLVRLWGHGFAGRHKASTHQNTAGSERQGTNQPPPIGNPASGNHWNTHRIDHLWDECHRANGPDLPSGWLAKV